MMTKTMSIMMMMIKAKFALVLDNSLGKGEAKVATVVEVINYDNDCGDDKDDDDNDDNDNDDDDDDDDEMVFITVNSD